MEEKNVTWRNLGRKKLIGRSDNPAISESSTWGMSSHIYTNPSTCFTCKELRFPNLKHIHKPKLDYILLFYYHIRVNCPKISTIQSTRFSPTFFSLMKMLNVKAWNIVEHIWMPIKVYGRMFPGKSMNSMN